MASFATSSVVICLSSLTLKLSHVFGWEKISLWSHKSQKKRTDHEAIFEVLCRSFSTKSIAVRDASPWIAFKRAPLDFIGIDFKEKSKKILRNYREKPRRKSLCCSRKCECKKSSKFYLAEYIYIHLESLRVQSSSAQFFRRRRKTGTRCAEISNWEFSQNKF